MATAGTLINGAALTFVGGGTALANVLSATAVSSAVGLGLAAYALTRPAESSGGGGYQQESSGYHKRQGLARARQGAVPKGARVVAIRDKGPKGKGKAKGQLREVKVSAGSIEGRLVRKDKNSEVRLHIGEGKNSEGIPVSVGRQSKNPGGRSGSVGRQNKQNNPSRPAYLGRKIRGKSNLQENHRSKRDQQDIELGPLAVLQYEEKLELQETLELIRQHDTAGCGKRLMCELGGMEQDQLTIEELSILNLVRPSGDDVQGEVFANQASLEYLDAKTRGQKGEKCGKVYSRCTLNGKQLMTIVMDYLP